jgi:glutaredoxin
MPEGQSSSSIIVGNCLACEGLVRVPATMNAKSTVRCPHCQETFSLLVLLDQAVPELEIVDADEKAGSDKPELYIDKQLRDQKDGTGKFVVPSQLAKGARRRGRSRRSKSRSSRRREAHERSQSQSPSFDENRSAATEISDSIETDRDKLNIDAVETRRDRNSQSINSRRPTVSTIERNPIAEMLKVALGAAVAIPIAYLVVLWGFGQDPLGFGRPIGKVIPMLVPEKFRNVQSEDLLTDPGGQAVEALDLKTDSSGISNIGSEALKGLDK